MSALLWFLSLFFLLPGPVRCGDEPRRDALLVAPAWLSEHLDDDGLVVLQVGERGSYARAHLPGALYVDLDVVSTSREASGQSRVGGGLVLEMPELASLEKVLRGWGISANSKILVVQSDGWVTNSGRLLFVLQWAGLQDQSMILDGGLDAWVKAGGLTSDERVEPEAGTLELRELRPRPELVVDAEWIQKRIPGDGFALVDCRPGVYFDGLKADHLDSVGHMPGAGSLPWIELIDERGVLLPALELRKVFAKAGVQPGDTVVGMCHIGKYASFVLFAARTLGHEVRLYDGSIEDWANRQLPLTTEAEPPSALPATPSGQELSDADPG